MILFGWNGCSYAAPHGTMPRQSALASSLPCQIGALTTSGRVMMIFEWWTVIYRSIQPWTLRLYAKNASERPFDGLKATRLNQRITRIEPAPRPFARSSLDDKLFSIKNSLPGFPGIPGRNRFEMDGTPSTTTDHYKL